MALRSRARSKPVPLRLRTSRDGIHGLSLSHPAVGRAGRDRTRRKNGLWTTKTPRAPRNANLLNRIYLVSLVSWWLKIFGWLDPKKGSERGTGHAGREQCEPPRHQGHQEMPMPVWVVVLGVLGALRGKSDLRVTSSDNRRRRARSPNWVGTLEIDRRVYQFLLYQFKAGSGAVPSLNETSIGTGFGLSLSHPAVGRARRDRTRRKNGL